MDIKVSINIPEANDKFPIIAAPAKGGKSMLFSLFDENKAKKVTEIGMKEVREMVKKLQEEGILRPDGSIKDDGIVIMDYIDLITPPKPYVQDCTDSIIQDMRNKLVQFCQNPIIQKK